MHKECDIHPLYLKAASTVPAEEYFTSKSITTKVLERREVLVGEMISREPQVLVGEMISTEPQVLVGEMISREPQVFGDREDVWFILLDVIPRGTPFVPPGISKRTSPALCIPCGHIGTHLWCCWDCVCSSNLCGARPEGRGTELSRGDRRSNR